MGGGPVTARAEVDVPGYGILAMAPDANAPLLVVFGGIDVHGVQSGYYMWNYMNSFRDRFHIFVASSNVVNGTLAHRSLMSTLKAQGLTPSRQILYLFSGGWAPGMNVLTSDGPALFSSIYLVDIWMKSGSLSPDFYTALVNGNAAKIAYVYTTFGANNEAVRNYIAKKLGQRAIFVEGKGMDAHMRTNTVAVRLLQ